MVWIAASVVVVRPTGKVRRSGAKATTGWPPSDTETVACRAVKFGPWDYFGLMLIAFVFVVINLVVDVLYTIVDPRLHLSTGRAS